MLQIKRNKNNLEGYFTALIESDLSNSFCYITVFNSVNISSESTYFKVYGELKYLQNLIFFLWSLCNIWWRIIFFNKKRQNLYSFEGKKKCWNSIRLFVVIFIALKRKRKKHEIHLSTEEQFLNCVGHTRGFIRTYFLFNLLIKFF